MVQRLERVLRGPVIPFFYLRRIFALQVLGADWAAVDGEDEDGLAWAGADQAHRASVLFRDTLGEGEAEAGSVLLAFTDEGFEEAVANGVGDAGAIVGDGDGDGAPGDSGDDGDRGLPGAATRGLAGVEKQVIDGAFHLLGVDDSAGRAGVVAARTSRVGQALFAD